MVYWYGTTTLAGASLSERLTHTSAPIATTPSSASNGKSCADGVTQPNGASTAPTTSVVAICVETSARSAVPRNTRVVTSSTAYIRLPASAISAGQENVAG